MSSREQQFLSIVSGAARGVAPSLARGGLAVVEPFYRAAMAVRNRLFEAGIKKSFRIDRPVVSVGNITTGGTGKTPVVAWLADALRRDLNGEIGILTRGYKSKHGRSDEATLLQQQLNNPPAAAVHVIVNPDRVAGAHWAVAQHPSIRVFVADDAFQHRRLARDFDLVLIDATNPFGYGHVLPRGLLRESPRGLRRADAVLLTRCNLVSIDTLQAVRAQILSIQPEMPMFECSHRISGFQRASAAVETTATWHGRRVVAFAGIGNPTAFEKNLRDAGCEVAATAWFPDHHNYSAGDLARVCSLARDCSAQSIVTTSKDAVKLPDGAPTLGTPIYVAELSIEFAADHAKQLLAMIVALLPL